MTVVFARCPFWVSLSLALPRALALVRHASDSPHRLSRPLLPLVFFSAEAALPDGGSVPVGATFGAVAALSTRAAPVHAREREEIKAVDKYI